MNISFKTRKLQKTINSSKLLTAQYGVRRSGKIKIRFAVLRSSETLADVPTAKPVRRHQLSGKRKGEYAVDVQDSYRIIFIPDHDPVPRLDDGGVDLARVTAIKILEITDYH